MKCRIKRINKEKHERAKDSYYVKFLFFNDILSKIDLKTTRIPVCDWSNDITLAKVFNTKREAEKEAKKYKLRHIEFERVN